MDDMPPGLRHFEVPDSDVAELEDMLSDDRLTEKVRTRVEVVLLRADLLSPRAISEQTGMSRTSVHKWIKRYTEHGIIGLQEQRPGTGQIGRRIARKSLKAGATKLLKRNKSLTWLDLEQLALTHICSIQDDQDGSVNASHARAKNEALRLLKDVMHAQRQGDGDADDFLDELDG